MTTDPTPEEVRKSIVPKSDQLNADDLVTGPITVTITTVKRGDREQPIIVEIEGHRPYKPCKTMRRVLIAVYTDDPRNWIGKQLTLYCDPEVTWAGVKVGGIRISHVSGITEPKTFLLTQTRGKKSEVVIYPIVELTDQERKYIESAMSEIAAATDAAELKSIGTILAGKSKAIQEAVRPAYGIRLKEIKG